MKKEIGSVEGRPGKSKKTAGKPKLPLAFTAGVRNLLGPKPVIHYSHRAALKIFEKLGIEFEVRHFGESRLGLLRWPLRKLAAGTRARRLVVAPGFGDTPLSWWSVLAALKPVLRREIDEVVLIDYPGYSGFLHNEAAFDSMSELMRVFGEVLDTLKPSIILGHSLGGWLAADYAAARPEIVKKLILVDPGGLVVNEKDRLNYRDLFAGAIESGSDHLLPHVFAKAPILLPFFAEEFFHFLKSDESRAFVQSFGDEHLLNDKVAKIQAETVILWGERDTLTPVKWIHQWLERLPADRPKSGILINGSGHSPQIEKPGILIALLTQIFLGRSPRDLAWFPFWKVVPPSGG